MREMELRVGCRGRSGPQQVPRGDQRLEAGHLDRGIDAAAPEDAAVVVLDLDVGGV